MDLFNNGNYKEAAEYYSSILKERGEDNAASFNLGASQYYMEDNVSALNRSIPLSLAIIKFAKIKK